MEHIYQVPRLTYVAEKDDHERVACSATVYLITKDTFNYTYEKVEYNVELATPEATTIEVTEERTVDHFQQFDIEFDVSTLDPLMFTDWDDLTEEQVIAWVKAAKDVIPLEEEGAAIVAEKKDKILNPKKYQYDTPPTPWRVRADQASAEQI